MNRILSSILCALGVCCGCSAGNEVLAPRDFGKAIAADTAACVLDVRHAAEYAEGHIRGARLLDVLDAKAFGEGMEALDRTRTYYVYCRSGRRSHEAWRRLTECGFKAYDLEGGILNWVKCGMPVVK